MPKGNPGMSKPKQRDRRLRELSEDHEREMLAEFLRDIYRAKGSLPPTPGEIEVARHFGVEGIQMPKPEDRWHFRQGHGSGRN
jgi:hypothetical protein